RLQSIEGVGTEEAHRAFPAESFSLIVSRAVVEEIHLIDRAFASLDRLLEPGGLMLHKIDLRDYGMFSNHGLHPLEFLTVPDALYTMMTAYSGQPNRRRIDYYRSKMRELGYFAGLLVTAVVGQPGEIVPHKPSVELGTDYTEETLELIREIRPRLARRFRHLPDADLLIAGVFLVARKQE
ncbi:MAG TPA: methyltransferase domain-containing protein, partial [Bryobacteraceae bacterium]